MSDQRQLNQQPFLSGGGEMGALIRQKNWAETELGDPAAWPQSLRTAVAIMLNSRYPMFVWWGPSYINIYNDGYIAVLGQRHPAALGQSAPRIWHEIWDVAVGPQAHAVMYEGQATWNERALLIMQRNGYTEETYFTFSYSPIPGDAGETGGVFCACTEDTQEVLAERRLRLLREISLRSDDAETVEDVCRFAADALSAHNEDVTFALFYVSDSDGAFRLTANAGSPESASWKPSTLEVDNALWPVTDALRGETVIVHDLAGRSLPGGPWPESTTTVALIPIGVSGGSPQGLLIAGVSPRREFDGKYRDFFQLLGTGVSSAFARADALAAAKRRAQELAELDRLKTSFFSNVSHEFRTPLTLMLGPLESVLNDAEPLSSRVSESLDLAHRNALRLQKLVNALLDFSRIEAGRAEARLRPVDLSDFTRNLASTFRSIMERGNLNYFVQCDRLSRPAFVDPEMWEKVVLNLLSNAFKFTLSGSVALRLYEQGDEALLTVTDTGSGIPERELPRIFDRFHRVPNTSARTYEGTGIGLSLVAELVKLHHGGISVRSEVGRGTEFQVRIPLNLLAAKSEDTTPMPAVASVSPEVYLDEAAGWLAEVSHHVAHPTDDSSARPRILIADDNSDMRDYMRSLLSDRYEVQAVSDGNEALAFIQDSIPDLVLSDVMMPGLDGFGLLAALRQDERLHNVPIILVSARSGEEARVEGLDAGADDYLVKPFSSKELLARVSSHLRLAGMRAEASAAVREREELLQQAAEAANLGTWRWVLSSARLEVSPFSRHILGFSESQELTRDSVLSIIAPEEVNKLRAAALESVANAGPFHVELKVVPPGGEEKCISVRGRYRPRESDISGVVFDVSNLRKKDEELRLVRLQLDAALTAAGVGIWIWDTSQSRVILRNIEQIIGVSPERYRNGIELEEYFGLVHEEDRDQVREEVNRVTREPGSLEMQYRLLRSDGEVRWVIARGSAQVTPAGPILYGAIVDVTEHKAAETALRESRTQLSLAVVAGELGTFDVNLATGDIQRSLRHDQILGYDTLQPMFGVSKLFEHITADDRERVQENMQAALSSGSPLELETSVIRNDGILAYIWLRGQQYVDNAGVRHLVGVVADLTQRRLAENTLRGSEEKFRSLAGTIPQLIWTADHNGEVQYLSSQWTDYTGVEHAHLMERSIRVSLVHPDDRENALEEWAKFNQRTEPLEIRLRLRHRSGDYRWNLVRGLAVLDGEGTVLMRVGTYTDLHEQLEIEDALRRANQDLQQFAYSASHDLQEPLRNIRMYGELVSSRYRGKLDENSDQLLSFITDSARHMGDLLADLLAYTQTVNVDRDHHATVDAKVTAERVLRLLQRAIVESSAEVSFGPLPIVGVRDSHLEQLFLNLLSNAIKYRQENVPPMISITATAAGDSWLFAVKDNGIGIASSYHDLIFGIFKRLHGKDSRYTGTGIGLAICRRIVEGYGRRIWVESQLGGGSTFYFELPVASTGD